MGKSLCCNSDTRIGYYNNSKYSDIIGCAVANLGTYCIKCNKPCSYKRGNKYYYCDGQQFDIKESRKIKIEKLNKKI